MRWSKRTSGWSFATVAGASIFSICALELAARRGWSFDPYLANKVVASTALILIAGSFLISACAHFWGWFAGRRAWARPVGLTGFGLATLHVVMTLTISNPSQAGSLRFAFPGFYLDHWLSTGFAIGGLLLLGRMALASFPSSGAAARRLGAKRWQRTMRSGYVAVVLLVLHAGLLKFPGWLRWVRTLDPVLPPLSLLVSATLIAMIAVKAAHIAERRDPVRTQVRMPVRAGLVHRQDLRDHAEGIR